MYYIGVDLGGTNIAVGIVDKNARLLNKTSVKTENSFERIIEAITGCILSLANESNISLEDVISVGIGCPGIVNAKKGEVVYANNLSLQNAPVVSELSKRLNKKVYINNDANCAALGESIAGAAKNYKNAFVITLGTGVGGGVIVDGKLFEGTQSAGTEFGHIVLRFGGIKCTCGRYGCWESYASATALISQTKKAIEKHPESLMSALSDGGKSVSGRTAFDAARKKDKTALKVIDRYIRYIAEGLIDIINIFRPEIILIGGGIGNEGEFLLKPVREYVHKFSYANDYVSVPVIEKALLGNDAGIIGAAMLAIQ